MPAGICADELADPEAPTALAGRLRAVAAKCADCFEGRVCDQSGCPLWELSPKHPGGRPKRRILTPEQALTATARLRSGAENPHTQGHPSPPAP